MLPTPCALKCMPKYSLLDPKFVVLGERLGNKTRVCCRVFILAAIYCVFIIPYFWHIVKYLSKMEISDKSSTKQDEASLNRGRLKIMRSGNYLQPPAL